MTKMITPRNAITAQNSSTSSHTGRRAERVVLPMPPELSDLAAGLDTRFEMEVYARFMRHLRDVPNSRMEIKILSAILFTADMMDAGEDIIAKTLVDLGLRAPRRAFPQAFLEFCDKCALRRSWDVGAGAYVPPPSITALKNFWEGAGENLFSPLPTQYAVWNEGVMISR